MYKITNSDIIKNWEETIWQHIEEFGDEGDFSRKYILNPVLLKLLGKVKGKKVLDAGSGNGYLSRMLARAKAKVTAIEPAKNFYTYALKREEKEKLGITYIKEDLSKFTGRRNYFDIVVANLVFMDIPDYQTAMRNSIGMLKKNGIFIFSILHPCFDVQRREYAALGSLIIKEYFKYYPIPQTIGYSFHRTLSDYLNLVTENSCKILNINEPQLSEEFLFLDEHYEKDAHIPSFLLVKAEKEL